jgi:hypothetical protein
MEMYKQTFYTGGFVLHRVNTFNAADNGGVTFSAWYNKAGELQDAERRDSRRMSRLDTAKAVRLGPIWKGECIK